MDLLKAIVVSLLVVIGIFGGFAILFAMMYK